MVFHFEGRGEGQVFKITLQLARGEDLAVDKHLSQSNKISIGILLGSDRCRGRRARQIALREPTKGRGCRGRDGSRKNRGRYRDVPGIDQKNANRRFETGS